MSVMVVEITGIDDDVAEQAYRRAVKAMNQLTMVLIKEDTLLIEPHDDTRGIWARVEFSFSVEGAVAVSLDTDAVRYHIMKAMSSYINIELTGRGKASIHIRFPKQSGEEMEIVKEVE